MLSTMHMLVEDIMYVSQVDILVSVVDDEYGSVDFTDFLYKLAVVRSRRAFL